MPEPIFITGAESTGKSTLTGQLARHYGGAGTEEFARTYLMNLKRHYTLEDLNAIAHGQIRIIKESRKLPLVFVDTDLINLKVWYDEVFHFVPDFLLESISLLGSGHYLLCQPDIPWEPDPLRENPNRREFLNGRYEDELIRAGFPFHRVTGTGASRLECAIQIVDKILSEIPRTDHHV
jgi:nicotinamide riboside kinase